MSWPSTTSFASRGHWPRRVQDGPVLGDVDSLSTEHGLEDPLAQTRPPRERDQERNRVVRDAVLRVVEVETGGLDVRVRIGREDPQM